VQHSFGTTLASAANFRRHNTQHNDTQHITLTINSLYVTLSLADPQHNNALHYAECHYAECHALFIFMLSVLTLIVVMLTVDRLNVIMLSVVGPNI
jgi:hypothetical protein